MSKKSKRRKQRAVHAHPPQKVIFTFSAVRMLKDALYLMKESFVRNTEPLPNLKLAEKTLEGLQIKLDEMLQGEEWEKETPFDYNEVRFLCAAIHMYLAKLHVYHQSTQMPDCITLCTYFSKLVERIELQSSP